MIDQPIAVIGIGAMGGAIATRLLECGVPVAVWDTSDAAVASLVQRGATRFDPTSPAVAAVLVSLPSDEAVAEALTDEVLSRIPGTLLVELSTVLPSTVQALAERARPHRVEVVDAPVSGSPSDALAGSLVLMVGATEAALSRASPILELLGAVQHIGDVGTGKAMKLVNNAMSMGNMAVAAEAFTLGRRLGLDEQTMYEVISRSGGRSNQFEKRMPLALDGDYAPRFALRLAEKDLRLALASGHEVRHPMPIAATVHQLYEAGVARDLGDEDVVAILKLYGGVR